MVNKCLCGSYTNYGTMCVACTMARVSEDESEEMIDIEDYLEDEEEDDETT
jgi:hypothetical protein